MLNRVRDFIESRTLAVIITCIVIVVNAYLVVWLQKDVTALRQELLHVQMIQLQMISDEDHKSIVSQFSQDVQSQNVETQHSEQNQSNEK